MIIIQFARREVSYRFRWGGGTVFHDIGFPDCVFMRRERERERKKERKMCIERCLSEEFDIADTKILGALCVCIRFY